MKRISAQFSSNAYKDFFFIVSGIFAAAFGLESFLLPNRFIDGGATGISLLITEVLDAPIYLMLILVNLPFLFLGFQVIGKGFALKASAAIVGLSAVLFLFEFPEVTQDRLLVAVFGGFFLGAGIGLSIRGGAVLDGTEVLAIYLSRKAGLKIGDIIILINVVIFLYYYLMVVKAAYLLIPGKELPDLKVSPSIKVLAGLVIFGMIAGSFPTILSSCPNPLP